MMGDQKGLKFMCAMLNSRLDPSDFGPLWQVLPEGQDQSEGIDVKILNDILLGIYRWRVASVLPRNYSYNNGLSIAEGGFQLSKGQRFLYGRGIYSTPDINVAFLYAPTVELKGKEYKIVIQNRVNPVGLIKVSIEETGVGGYWISASDDDVRPYGIKQ